MFDMFRLFHPDTARWFTHTLGEPTPVQQQAWPAIIAGEHVLLSAPTGTGKTLAAFLVLIDDLKRRAREGALPDTLQVIYVSPLKALGNDIRENLRRPLEGIGGPEVRIAIRTGDTTPTQRQEMLRHPPHMLITTPESLYLLLTTAKGRTFLSTARTVVLDELHVLLGNKRGAHLFLSLARLDALCTAPLQRIGLSATVHPLQRAAEIMAYGKNVRIIAPEMEKRAGIEVNGPLEDMRVLAGGTVWTELYALVYACCREHKTVIAFVEGRAQAEKLAHGVNEIAGEGFALTHHGSLSKEQRLEAEEALRSGKLRLLCATSSMELGIDVGDVDLVLQIGCPQTVSSALQRLGRAGHRPGSVSNMHIFPRTAAEGLTCGITATLALEGKIEPIKAPTGCLDVLAQHLLSMAVDAVYTVDQAVNVIHNVYHFKNITKEEVQRVLEMLYGAYEHALDKPVRPRILYDRIHETVSADAYGRMLALSGGGTIPDRGLFPVCLPDGTRLGELDEEFVFEARVGDKFLLGAFAWRIQEIHKDRVIVSTTTPEGAQPPFWRGDGLGRSYQSALRFAAHMRQLDTPDEQLLTERLKALHMDDYAARNAARYLRGQLQATGCIPNDQLILTEEFSDEAGESQLMIHSLFGRRVNYGLALLLQRLAGREMDREIRVFEDDDGILLYAGSGVRFPRELLYRVDPDSAEALLRAILPSTALFSMAFRYNAARALMMGSRGGKRVPLWVQRLRGAETLRGAAEDWQHPLMAETLRECLQDYLDIPALKEVLLKLRSGEIQLREIRTETPSTMALPLRRAVEAVMMYEYSPIPQEAITATQKALEEQEGLKPEAELLRLQGTRKKEPENAEELHSLMMIEGDLRPGETQAPVSWLEALAREERVLYIAPGLWICREQEELYLAAERGEKSARERLARRCLRYRGAQDAFSLGERYFWDEESCAQLLKELCAQGIAREEDGFYYHGELYARARRETLLRRRSRIKTQPAERFAALLTREIHKPGTAEEQLQECIGKLSGCPQPIKSWEQMIFPARVKNYTPALLDKLLAQGTYVWQVIPGEKPALVFYPAGDIDWETALPSPPEGLPEDEKNVLLALQRRGASFSHALAPAAGRERSVIEVLFALAMKGLVRADSLLPLRQGMLLAEKRERTPKQIARIRAAAQQAGRWECVRPLRQYAEEELLEREFARVPVLCRETVTLLPWKRALELLRVWEYTGKVRRGYYVKGLSGAQFVAQEQYARVTAALEAPAETAVWLNSADPEQPWGKYLPHPAGKAFARLQGTAVCLRGGVPVALLEQSGKTLRILQDSCAEESIHALREAFVTGGIFSEKNRLVIKNYPKEYALLLKEAGFYGEMLDYVLFRD